jgi:hypothetical protein
MLSVSVLDFAGVVHEEMVVRARDDILFSSAPLCVVFLSFQLNGKNASWCNQYFLNFKALKRTNFSFSMSRILLSRVAERSVESIPESERMCVSR